MASMSSISVGLSGLRAAQAGLSVTGHNVSNSSVIGYTRQQAIQNDFSYRNLGSSPVGSLKMQAGLGTNVAQIRQLRNKFYDKAFREENSFGGYYYKKYTAGEEINNIIGELQSEYKAQDVIADVWNSLNEISKDPGAIETRSSFIQSCVTLLNKMQDINKSLFEYQLNLNQQVKKEVETINNLTSQIAELNKSIEQIEADGSRANDLRDARNNLLDELSGYIDIEIKETPVGNGGATRMDILFQGNELLVGNIQQKIGLKYCNGDYPFVEPVFTSSKDILPASDTSTPLFPNLAQEDLGTNSSSTKGSLKGLLVSRGEVIGNFDMKDDQIGNFSIPNVQKKIDTLVHEMVTLLNEKTKNGFGLDGNKGVEIFVRKSGAVGNETPGNYATLYTLDNLKINPALLEADGYNKLGFSTKAGDVGDNSIVLDILNEWKKERGNLEGASIDGYYKKIITDFAVKIQEDREKLESKLGVIDLAQNKRVTISGVSLDEELSNMLKFQHAYNSAAKIINVIDGMMDKVINGTGRVGI
ncbi:flagellar hook-associated protein FlgK [uncultured Tyzzerella sp.]|uniref:flagellar hook-associated protein FlgK n=1 Tax=uncultured Tyzzerella sp. TaxID=2321398 RepID=UPI002943AC9F|nr:flagellar hook-associated protein FlgK [uncultured Tyzzerella sp.]